VSSPFFTGSFLSFSPVLSFFVLFFSFFFISVGVAVSCYLSRQ
jgi:hypothetical protein